MGITLPMQWDIRVAAESARIGFVFVRRGVVPEALSLWTVPRMIGVAKANELLMTGRIITAREALEFGIVSHVWPDAEFMPKVREMALDIAQNTAPVSVAITKRLIYACSPSPRLRKRRKKIRARSCGRASSPTRTRASARSSRSASPSGR